jgi:hypothetical protein
MRMKHAGDHDLNAAACPLSGKGNFNLLRNLAHNVCPAGRR